MASRAMCLGPLLSCAALPDPGIPVMTVVAQMAAAAQRHVVQRVLTVQPVEARPVQSWPPTIGAVAQPG
jgi:hypothetical protein